MRAVISGLGLGLLTLLAGCNLFPPRPNPSGGGTGPQLPSGTPTAPQLVTYLNANSQKLQSLQCQDVDLDCTQKLQSVHLGAKLACQKPKNFRLVASLMGNSAVDLGSNDQEFWYWISKADPPYLFHCGHQDYGTGKVKMPFPFQPEWVMEALGLVELDPAKNYQVTTHQRTVELVEQTTSPQGTPVRKVTIFNRNSNNVQVAAHVLQDANGKEICAAYVSEVHHDRATGAVVPRRVQLVWPSEKITLKMKLDGVTINPQLDQQRTAALFGRPRMPDVQTYDLARGLDAGPSGLRQTRGYSR